MEKVVHFNVIVEKMFYTKSNLVQNKIKICRTFLGILLTYVA
jgi:hypothetical protein